MRAKLNVVISGGTGAGKTTLLNALSAAVPGSERIITVEDNAELRLQQPHVVALEARPTNVEGRGEVTIRDLVRNSLRMRPDRIIVGEVRGGETLDMLQALNTGHEGSLVTVHANSADDAMHRLETLATMSDLQLPFEALRDQINNAIDVIVQIDRYADGRRRIAEVAVVASSRRETFRLAPVARFDAEPVGADRRVTGRFVARAAAGADRPPAGARRRAACRASSPRRRRVRPRCARPSAWPPARDAQALLLLVGRAGARAARDRRLRQRRRAALRAGDARRPADDENRLRRTLACLDVRARRTARGRRLATWLSSAAVPAGPVDFVLGCAGATPALYLAGTLFLPPVMAFVLALASARAAPACGSSGDARSGATCSSPSCPRSRGCWPTAPPPASPCRPRSSSPRASSRTRPRRSCTTVIEELRVGQPVDDALDSMRRRLPSRELGVLMTTLVIQQRAGGDTVRALNELGQALEARKDLIREIRTMLSGAVFTSYLVVGIGVGAILAMNLMAPGVMREMATSLAGIATLVFTGTLWAVAFVLIRRTTRVDV